MRVILALGLVVLVLASCGVHSTLECTDRIPCPDGMECNAGGQCVLLLPEDAPGDGRPRPDGADASEGPPDASGDAAPGCGDGVCLGAETCVVCPEDCGECPFRCGDGACQSAAGEDCLVCPADCGPCGDCAHDPCQSGVALDEACHPCVGELCFFDPFCCASEWDGPCVEELALICPGLCMGRCGDGTCAPDGTESCDTCPVDCGPCDRCGDGACDLAAGESCDTCPVDCGPCDRCGDARCSPGAGESCSTCPVDCGACPCVDQELGGMLPIVTTGSTAGRGNDQTRASCGDGGATAPDVVFRWTAPASATYRFTTSGSSFDTILSARAGDCSGAELACNDDAPGGGLHSVFQRPLAAGQTIVLVLDGWGGTSGAYSLRIEQLGGTSCADFTLPSMVPASATGSTLGAGNDQRGGCGDTSAPDHVYAWVVPFTATYRIDTAGSAYDTLLYVRAGDCSGPLLACNDDVVPGGDLSSLVNLSLTGGDRVFIVVDGWASSAGSYQLHVAVAGMSCLHDECLEGEALATDCSPCATRVCAVDAFCCASAWDRRCVGEAEALCGVTCGP